MANTHRAVPDAGQRARHAGKQRHRQFGGGQGPSPPGQNAATRRQQECRWQGLRDCHSRARVSRSREESKARRMEDDTCTGTFSLPIGRVRLVFARRWSLPAPGEDPRSQEAAVAMCRRAPARIHVVKTETRYTYVSEFREDASRAIPLAQSLNSVCGRRIFTLAPREAPAGLAAR